MERQIKTYATDSQGRVWGATIAVSETAVCNTTGKAFIAGVKGVWRCVEWFSVPEEIKESLFDSAIEIFDN